MLFSFSTGSPFHTRTETVIGLFSTDLRSSENFLNHPQTLFFYSMYSSLSSNLYLSCSPLHTYLPIYAFPSLSHFYICSLRHFPCFLSVSIFSKMFMLLFVFFISVSMFSCISQLCLWNSTTSIILLKILPTKNTIQFWVRTASIFHDSKTAKNQRILKFP